MSKFVLRVMTPCSGDVEFESGLERTRYSWPGAGCIIPRFA